MPCTVSYFRIFLLIIQVRWYAAARHLDEQWSRLLRSGNRNCPGTFNTKIGRLNARTMMYPHWDARDAITVAFTTCDLGAELSKICIELTKIRYNNYRRCVPTSVQLSLGYNITVTLLADPTIKICRHDRRK